MNLYTYRYCKLSEIDKFKEFIDKHWRKGHILSYSDDLIKFQYGVEGEDRLTIVVAVNNETHDFDGVYGYITTHKYDTTKQIPKVLWGAVWKVRDDINNPLIGKVGLGLLKYILKNEEYDAFSVLGVSEVNKQIASALHFTMGELNHFYCASNSVTEFKIAKKPKRNKGAVQSSDCFVREVLLPLDNYEFFENDNYYKNIPYIRNRYENHPFFKYRFLGIYKGDELKGIFVFRRISVANNHVLRIIDFIGSLKDVENVSDSLQELLLKEGAEYIDCLNYGLSKDDFLRLGFNEVLSNDDTIIPEYFEPFEQRYVPMEFEYISDCPLIIFKGDGDQDRPNKI